MMKDPYEVLYVLAAGFFYILFAGGYAFSYTVYKMNENPFYKQLAYALLAGMIYCTYVLTTNHIFSTFWKGLITFATVAYIFIPFGMWKVVVKIHQYEEELRKKQKEITD